MKKIFSILTMSAMVCAVTAAPITGEVDYDAVSGFPFQASDMPNYSGKVIVNIPSDVTIDVGERIVPAGVHLTIRGKIEGTQVPIVKPKFYIAEGATGGTIRFENVSFFGNAPYTPTGTIYTVGATITELDSIVFKNCKSINPTNLVSLGSSSYLPKICIKNILVEDFYLDQSQKGNDLFRASQLDNASILNIVIRRSTFRNMGRSIAQITKGTSTNVDIQDCTFQNLYCTTTVAGDGKNAMINGATIKSIVMKNCLVGKSFDFVSAGIQTSQPHFCSSASTAYTEGWDIQNNFKLTDTYFGTNLPLTLISATASTDVFAEVSNAGFYMNFPYQKIDLWGVNAKAGDPNGYLNGPADIDSPKQASNGSDRFQVVENGFYVEGLDINVKIYSIGAGEVAESKGSYIHTSSLPKGVYFVVAQVDGEVIKHRFAK